MGVVDALHKNKTSQLIGRGGGLTLFTPCYYKQIIYISSGYIVHFFETIK